MTIQEQDQELNDLETQVSEEFESRQEPEPEAEPEEPQEEEEAPEEPEEAASVDDAEQAQRLYRYFQSRPDMAQALVDLEQGRVQIAPLQPEPAPEPPAEDFDFWSNPEESVKQLHQRIQTQEQYIAQRQYSDTLASIQTGKQVFAQTHPDLKPEEIETVANDLVNSGTFPAYWSRNPSHIGVAQALEDRYRTVFFDRSRDAVAKDLVANSAKKRRAASVGTSRASSPRVEPVPTDPKEKRQAMVKELEDWINNAQ